MCCLCLLLVSVFAFVHCRFLIGNALNSLSLYFLAALRPPGLSSHGGRPRCIHCFPIRFPTCFHYRLCRPDPVLRLPGLHSLCSSPLAGTPDRNLCIGQCRLQSGHQSPISPPSTSSQPMTVTLPTRNSLSSPGCGREPGSSSSSNSMRGLPVCSASSIALFTISVRSRST